MQVHSKPNCRISTRACLYRVLFFSCFWRNKCSNSTVKSITNFYCGCTQIPTTLHAAIQIGNNGHVILAIFHLLCCTMVANCVASSVIAGMPVKSHKLNLRLPTHMLFISAEYSNSKSIIHLLSERVPILFICYFFSPLSSLLSLQMRTWEIFCFQCQNSRWDKA